MSFLDSLQSRICITGLSFCVSFLFEGLMIADSKSTIRNMLFNSYHGFIYYVIDSSLGAWCVVWLTMTVEKLPFAGVVNLDLPTHGKVGLGILLSFLALLIYDFFYYWMHRFQHWSKWLWAEHELHHSDEHVNVTTGVRHHHLEIFMKAIFIAVPLAILFRLPAVNFGLAFFLTQSFVFFIHANARVSFGPFNRFMASPQVHRIHHSIQPEHIDKNFAAYFPIWDVIFGTYYHPKPGEYPPTGLVSGRTVYSLREAAMMPFVSWATMLKARRQSSVSNNGNAGLGGISSTP